MILTKNHNFFIFDTSRCDLNGFYDKEFNEEYLENLQDFVRCYHISEITMIPFIPKQYPVLYLNGVEYYNDFLIQARLSDITIIYDKEYIQTTTSWLDRVGDEIETFKTWDINCIDIVSRDALRLHDIYDFDSSLVMIYNCECYELKSESLLNTVYQTIITGIVPKKKIQSSLYVIIEDKKDIHFRNFRKRYNMISKLICRTQTRGYKYTGAVLPCVMFNGDLYDLKDLDELLYYRKHIMTSKLKVKPIDPKFTTYKYGDYSNVDTLKSEFEKERGMTQAEVFDSLQNKYDFGNMYYSAITGLRTRRYFRDGVKPKTFTKKRRVKNAN